MYSVLYMSTKNISPQWCFERLAFKWPLGAVHMVKLRAFGKMYNCDTLKYKQRNSWLLTHDPDNKPLMRSRNKSRELVQPWYREHRLENAF